MMKLCIFCKHFEFYGGYAASYGSEDTRADCYKRVLPEIDLSEWTTKELRKHILTAKNCQHYQQVSLKEIK